MYDTPTKTYVGQTGAVATFTQTATAPPQPTRFSNCAGMLEARVAHVAGLFERLARVADRLGGPVPEEAQNGNKIRGGGNSIVSQIENTLEDFDVLTRRAERTVERLEQL